jgi:competence protein ComEC
LSRPERSRQLLLQHWLAAALCLGLALSNAHRVGLFTAAIGLIALASLTAVCGRRELRLMAALLLFVLIGVALGSLRLASLDRELLLPWVGKSALSRVVVTGPPRSSEYGVSAPGRIERFGRVPVGERVWLDLPAGRTPAIGAVLELEAEIELPKGPSASGFDQREWLARQGIHIVVKGGFWRQVGHRGGVSGFGDRLRERLAHDLAPGLSGERRGLVLGFVLGEDEGLPPSLRTSFRRSGLYHLLAVSGQNIAFLVAGVLGACWLLGVPRRLGEILALGTIGAYVLVVGWQPSVVRAAVAGSLASLAWLAARPKDRWYFLLLGAVVLLAWNPRSIYDAGFQLSFMAVLAIFLAEKPIERRIESWPLPKSVRPVIAVSLACSLATAPIMIFQFGKVPVYGVIANAFVEPVFPVILFLALAGALVAPIAFPAAQALAWVNGLLASYIAFWARFSGALPGAQVSRARLLELAPVLLALFASPFLIRPRLPRVVVLALTAAVPLWGWQHRPLVFPSPPSGLRITFLDVGEGDATLLQTPDGAVLVDAGPPEADVAGQLRRLGVRRIEMLLLSHPHRDHVGGAAEVLAKEEVGFVLDSGLPAGGEDERAALEEARSRGVPVRLGRAGQELALGDLRLHVLSPSDETVKEAAEAGDANEAAIVVIASYGSTDALLPADAESPFTLPLVSEPVEVYKVAHHGSADDGLPALLKILRPEIAVISVGRNDYGHPTPSTLRTLAHTPGLDVFRIDRDGPVTLESDGCAISLRAPRAETVSLPCNG